MELKNAIKSVECIKALGVMVDANLTWKDHINKVISKTSATIAMIKHIRRWISQPIALQAVTSQYFGVAYCGAPVWFTNNLRCNMRKR